MIYSQNNEQDVILRFFGGTIGRFLDIGAHDGQSLSNTRALAMRGWCGVLVEPHPAHFLKLWELYGGDPRMTLVNSAVSSGFGLSRLHFNYEGPAYSSTLIEEKAIEFKANDYSNSFMVSVCSIREIGRLGPYDFVSIDAEGMEIPILANAHDVLLEPRLVCVDFCLKSKATILAQLSAYKFQPIHETPENIIAARQL